MHVPGFLRPAFPDAGRLIVQIPALTALAAGHALSGRVLNAGCGEGAYCAWIESQPNVTRIDNVDLSVHPSFLERHPDPRHHLEPGSLTALPFADASMDAIVCTEVIEHIPDDAAAVAELARVLKPGGVLIASVPLLPAPFDPSHAREGYSEASFRALLSEAGFVVEESRTCCHAILRAVMHYWRAPLVGVGGICMPYVPNVVRSLLARADRVLRIGAPWDLVIRATRR